MLSLEGHLPEKKWNGGSYVNHYYFASWNYSYFEACWEALAQGSENAAQAGWTWPQIDHRSLQEDF